MIRTLKSSRARHIPNLAWVCLVVCHPVFVMSAHAATPGPLALSAAENAEVATRFAVHDTFDRLVLSLPPGTQATSHQTGDTLSLQLPGCRHVTQPSRWGHRLLALRDAPGLATLLLAPGMRTRVWPLGDRLVVDVMNAPVAALPPHAPPVIGASPVSTPLRPMAAPAPPVPSRSLLEAKIVAPAGLAGQAVPASSPSAMPLASAPPQRTPSDFARVQAPAPAQTAKAIDTRTTDPASVSAAGSAVLPLAREGEIDGPAVLVPCPRGTGAAAFQRAGEAHIVFDQSKPLDLSALKDDPVFGDIREQVLPDGLDLRLHVPAAGQLRLSRRTDGWALIVTPSAHLPALPAFEGHVQQNTLVVGAKAPSHVITLADDVTGGRLLVGTQTGDGQRMPAAHVAPEFTILPSWQGLVVAQVSDRLVMRSSATGFELSAQTPPELALAWTMAGAVSWPDGRVMTRSFDLPDLPPESLHRRLAQALRDAALAPKPARFAPRLAVARNMLAQGMDVEAAAVLHTALADDPVHLGEPAISGLSAVSDWLSAKAGGAEASRPSLDPARLGGSDEAVLWGALLQPNIPDAASQAASLAPVWPLIFNYPQALRRPMLLASAALLQAGGQKAAWTALLSASSDPALDRSRAALLRQQGKTDAALALLDHVAAGPDRLARAEAMEQALELRLAMHRVSESTAADLLDRQIYEWRGDGRELKLRMRVAALRAQAGDWRTALSLLRAAERIFPDAHTALHEAEEKTVADLLDGGRASKLASFDLVSLAEEAANLFSSADIERRLGPILVDKLLALDLPERAEPILRKLLDRAPDSRQQSGIRPGTGEPAGGPGRPPGRFGSADHTRRRWLGVGPDRPQNRVARQAAWRVRQGGRSARHARKRAWPGGQ